MMEIFEIFLFIFVGLYVFKTLLLLYGTTKLTYNRNKWQPNVSIVIVARNEEKNIGDCLESLTRLEYPGKKLEIILIDDRSTDKTGEYIRLFAEQYPNVKPIIIDDNPSDGLSGKASAISKGIEICEGTIVLMTDADCVLPEQWVSEYVSYFVEDVGLVAGITLLDEAEDETPLFGKIQSTDWAYLLTIGAGAVGIGVPLSCVGNNFAFRKQVYDEVGGFKNLGFSLTEDSSFVRAIIQQKKWKVRYTIDPSLLVQSKPMNSFKSFYHQRKRWATGSFLVSFFGKLLIIIAILTHILIPISFFIHTNWSIPIYSIALILLSDFFVLLRTTWLLKRLDLLKYFPLFELFYFFYTTLYSVIMPFNGRIEWKDVVYDMKKGEVCNGCS